MVEILTYAFRGEDEAGYKARFGEIIEGCARIALEEGSKVLKLPFPGSAASCRAISDLAGGVPWAVLSAGVDHQTFLGQVEIAMKNGASGVIAGRALWKDLHLARPQGGAGAVDDRRHPPAPADPGHPRRLPGAGASSRSVSGGAKRPDG